MNAAYLATGLVLLMVGERIGAANQCRSAEGLALGMVAAGVACFAAGFLDTGALPMILGQVSSVLPFLYIAVLLTAIAAAKIQGLSSNIPWLLKWGLGIPMLWFVVDFSLGRLARQGQETEGLIGIRDSPILLLTLLEVTLRAALLIFLGLALVRVMGAVRWWSGTALIGLGSSIWALQLVSLWVD